MPPLVSTMEVQEKAVSSKSLSARVGVDSP